MADSENPISAGADNVLVAVRGLMGLMVPVVAIIVAAYSTKSAVEGDIRELRGDVSHSREILDGKLDRIRADLDSVRAELHGHTSMGVDGVGHPAGILLRIKQIEEDIQEIRKSP